MKEGVQERNSKGNKKVDMQRKKNTLMRRIFFRLEGKKADGRIQKKKFQEEE